ncbi:MAG: DUF1801 domain-containing protein [Bacteroidales bacterium]|nr:DUF1801 domain-containing protein [Bacteroidales bacterium]
MNAVLDFIYNHEGEQKDLLLYFHQMITANPGVTYKMSYRLPFYYRKSWICYLNPTKNHGMELAFLRGNELSNSQGLLEAKGRKQVSGITFYNLSEIPVNAVQEILQEALILDEEIRYSWKNRNKQ